MKDLIMKKRTILLFIITFFLSVIKIDAQSVWFINPTNGQEVTSTGYGSAPNFVALNLQYNKTTTASPYFIKLFPTPYANQQSNQGAGIDQWWYLPAGTYSWRLELHQYYLGQGFYKVAEQTITFTVKNTIKVSNSFNSGVVNIDGVVSPSGTEVHKITGESLLLGAINQPSSNQYYVWNQSGVNLSQWNKKPMGGSYSLVNYNQNFNYTIASSDNGTEIQSDMKKRFDITRNDQTEFDGSNSIIAAQIVEQNSGQISAPLQQTLNGKTYNFAGWTDLLAQTNTRTITPTDNETYSALYKYLFHSNNQTAYSTNSQRKFIRTVDGSLHSVYESMGYIWYEKSSDYGSTWQLMNNGRPIGNGEAKSPSICYLGNTLFIAYQYQSFVGITWFNSAGQSFIAADSIMNPLEEIINFESDASPVIEAKGDKVLLVYKKSGTLFYAFFHWYASNPDISFLKDGSLDDENNLPVNPTIAVDKSSSNNIFHLAWGEGDNIIRYQKISWSIDERQNFVVTISCDISNLAVNDGYTKNYVPSLVVLGDDLARASWIGERNTMTESGSIVDKRTVFRGVKCDGSSFSFWNFGHNVRSATIQKSNDNANYFITWNEEISGPPITYNTTKATNNTTLSVIKNLNTTGHYVQVCNGDTKYDMYGMVFNSSALPYLFSKTNNIQSYFDNPNKEQNGSAVYAGREGTVSKGESNIYYTVGDVMVDGSIINFKKITETTDINSNEDVKRYLETEPFGLNDNSSFLYSVQYGLTENTGSLFNNDEYINFKVKLVDAETNAVISVFDDINYSANNILPYNSLQYSVNTVGIGNRTVKLLLDINDNFGAVYSVTSKFADAEILPKAVRQEIGLGENINVTEYDLSQNYPNPFNPSTTIRYAIPKDGMVTLKIYDILGREVKTLVNNFKTKGRYEVNFDASNLSSGLYIYEIKSGDYKASKKMTLIK